MTYQEPEHEWKHIIEIKTDIWKGALYFIATTRVFDQLFSETGDTEEEALNNLRSAISNNNPKGIVHPPGYPRLVEVDW